MATYQDASQDFLNSDPGAQAIIHGHYATGVLMSVALQKYLNQRGYQIPSGYMVDKTGTVVQNSSWQDFVKKGVLWAGAGIAGGYVVGGAIAYATGGGATAAGTGGGAAAGAGTTGSTVPVTGALAPDVAPSGALADAGVGTAATSGGSIVDSVLGNTLGQKISTLLGIGGTALSVYGQLKAAESAKALGEFNASVDRTLAADALQRGALQAAQYQQGVAVTEGRQRAGFASQNVDVEQGSPVDVARDTRMLGAEDVKTIQMNAAREAWGYQQKAQADLLGANNQASADEFGAASTALTGTGSLLNARYGWGS